MRTQPPFARRVFCHSVDAFGVREPWAANARDPASSYVPLNPNKKTITKRSRQRVREDGACLPRLYRHPALLTFKALQGRALRLQPQTLACVRGSSQRAVQENHRVSAAVLREVELKPGRHAGRHKPAPQPVPALELSRAKFGRGEGDECVRRPGGGAAAVDAPAARNVVVFGCEDARIVSDTPLIFAGCATWTREVVTIDVMSAASERTVFT